MHRYFFMFRNKVYEALELLGPRTVFLVVESSEENPGESRQLQLKCARGERFSIFTTTTIRFSLRLPSDDAPISMSIYAANHNARP